MSAVALESDLLQATSAPNKSVLPPPDAHQAEILYVRRRDRHIRTRIRRILDTWLLPSSRLPRQQTRNRPGF